MPGPRHNTSVKSTMGRQRRTRQLSHCHVGPSRWGPHGSDSMTEAPPREEPGTARQGRRAQRLLLHWFLFWLIFGNTIVSWICFLFHRQARRWSLPRHPIPTPSSSGSDRNRPAIGFHTARTASRSYHAPSSRPRASIVSIYYKYTRLPRLTAILHRSYLLV
jgi:hypothetical protein